MALITDPPYRDNTSAPRVVFRERSPGRAQLTSRCALQPSGAVVNHSGPRLTEHVELSVAVVEVQRDSSVGRRRGAADLGYLELDSGGEIDPYPVLFTGRGADDGAASRFEHARN